MSGLIDKLKDLIAAEETGGDAPAQESEAEAPPWAQALVDRVAALEAGSSPPAAASVDQPGSGAVPPAAPAPAITEPPSNELAGAAPPASTTPPRGSWTAEQIEAMTPDEINRNWDSIEAQWKAESR